MIDAVDETDRDCPPLSITAQPPYFSCEWFLTLTIETAMLTVLVKSGLLAMAHMVAGFSVAYAATGSAGFAVGVALIGAHLISVGYVLLRRPAAKRMVHARR